MRLFISMLIIALALLVSGCNVRFIHEDVKYVPPEKISININHEEWYRATYIAKDGVVLSEYVRNASNRYDYMEAITTSFVSAGPSVIIERELYRLRDSLRKACPEVLFDILSKTNDEAVYGWHINNCEGVRDQHEFGRFILTSSGIHRVAYIQRTVLYTGEQQNKAVEFVSQAKVVKNDVLIKNKP